MCPNFTYLRLIKIPKCSYQSVSQILLLSWKREVLMVSCIWAWQMQSKNTSEVQKSRFEMRFCQTLPTSWHIWNIYATRGRYRGEGSPQTTFCESSFIGYDEINQNFWFEFKSSAFPTFCMNEEWMCFREFIWNVRRLFCESGPCDKHRNLKTRTLKQKINKPYIGTYIYLLSSLAHNSRAFPTIWQSVRVANCIWKISGTHEGSTCMQRQKFHAEASVHTYNAIRIQENI